MSDAQGSAGWFPDPTGRYEFRYWNGQRWTADVSVSGTRFVDPVGPSTYQPGWGPTSPQVQAAPSHARGMAVAAFVVGLVSVLIAWVPFIVFLGAAGAIAAFVFGILGLRKAAGQDGYGRPFAVTGIVFALVAGGLCVVGVMLTGRVIDEVNSYLDPGPVTKAITECSKEAGLVSAKGTVHNDDTVAHAYTVTVSYSSGGKVVATDLASVTSVAPGGTGSFESSAFVAVVGDLTCTVSGITGPPPFGLPGS